MSEGDSSGAVLTSQEGLKTLVVRGVAWKAASQILLQMSRMVVAIVLARLLTPFDYGLAGMVLVFSMLVYVIADLGLGAALIQRPTLTEKDRSTVFWTTVVAGLVLALGGVGLSWPIASFYGEPEVQPLFAALSGGFFLTALGMTQTVLLTKEMLFRKLELRTMVATLLAAAAAIGVAVLGYGAWAIIVQQLVVAGATTALAWLICPWRPTFAFSRESLRTFGGFGVNVLGSNFFFFLNRNVDNLLVGRFLGATALGYYALAYNLMLIPVSRLSAPLQAVLYPALARMQDQRERTIAVWIRVTGMLAAVMMPALLGLIVVAQDFVVVLLGRRWEDAVPVLQILAWVALLQTVSTLNARLLTAQNRTKLVLRFSFASFIVYVTAFALGLQWGVVGVASAYAIAATVIVQPVHLWLTARALEVRPARLLRSLTGVIQASAAMAGCVLGVRLLLVQLDVAPAVRLFALVALGVAVYVPLIVWRAPAVVREFRQLRPRSAT